MSTVETISEWVRHALAKPDGALLRLRDTMTPGQRQTAALAAALAAAVLLFGSPTHGVPASTPSPSTTTPSLGPAPGPPPRGTK